MNQLKSYEIYLNDEEKSGVTVQKYMRDVRRFLVFTDGRELNKPLVLSYKDALAQRYTTASANSMLAAINSYLAFIGRHDCRVKQFKLQKRAYCPEDRELSEREYKRLLQAAQGDKRLSLLIETICATGIRVSELSAITVESAEAGEAEVSCKGKTRVVFIIKSLCRKLLAYAKKVGIRSGMIFVTRSGKAIDRSNIWRMMKGLCAKARVKPSKVFPHNLRHLFARTFYKLEKDIAKLADILGHSNINTTRIYVITTGREHRRRLEQMHLVI